VSLSWDLQHGYDGKLRPKLLKCIRRTFKRMWHTYTAYEMKEGVPPMCWVCGRPFVKRRALGNVWGNVCDVFVCDEHHEKIHGKNVDSLFTLPDLLCPLCGSDQGECLKCKTMYRNTTGLQRCINPECDGSRIVCSCGAAIRENGVMTIHGQFVAFKKGGW